MNQTRRMGPAIQAEVTADYQGLPPGRIAEHQGAAYVFVDRLTDLEAWYLALGGEITHQPAGDSVTLWALNTLTERTHGAPLRVRALALDTDQIDADLTDAVSPDAA